MPNLFDTLSQATRDMPSAVDEAPYVHDVAYHTNAYMIESALRELGVLPDSAGQTDETKPYDMDLRKLIESVPVE